MSDVSGTIQEISIAKVGKEIRTPVSDVLNTCYTTVTKNKNSDPAIPDAVNEKISDGTLPIYEVSDGEITNSKYANKTISKEKLSSDIKGGLSTETATVLYNCLSDAIFQESANKDELLTKLKESLKLEDISG